MRVPFLSLTPGVDAAAVRQGIDRVLGRGWFVLGPELAAFEAEFADLSGARHAIGVGNGTDAIALTLRAIGVGPGDEVITSAVSAAFTGLAILMAGATPVFADVDDESGNVDPAAVESAITPRTAAIVPVHLYGQAADMTRLEAIASRHGIALVEDACQAHLATADGRPVGTMGVAGTFSFYPTKNLGALGDGGAIVTNDASIADRLKRLRNGGQVDRYLHKEFGVNSRLDELQAAVLRARLPFLREWTDRRRALARRYRVALTGAPVRVTPERDPGHVYHLFTVRSPARDALMRHLEQRGIGTIVHYPISLPAQPAFAGLADIHDASGVPAEDRRGKAGWPRHETPVANRLCAEVCSLPLHPGLTDADIDLVAAAVNAWQPEHPSAPASR
jgi:dTDP-3-amino-3,4,6-trideoxy-alpha-D-glucose transaminase